jgi:hypothetical protein
MKRCLFVLAFASVAVWGQNHTVVLVPNTLPDADQFKSFEDAFRPDALSHAKEMLLPGLLETAPISRTCVVPLLAAPINPNAGQTMPVLHPPKLKSENAEVVKGLPPCASRTAK